MNCLRKYERTDACVDVETIFVGDQDTANMPQLFPVEIENAHHKPCNLITPALLRGRDDKQVYMSRRSEKAGRSTT